jgi:hypothetical protein
MRRQIGILHHALEDCRHTVIVTAQRRIVRYSERQDFSHDVLAAGVVSSLVEKSGRVSA